MHGFAAAVLILIGLRWVAQAVLEHLNRRALNTHRNHLPPEVEGLMDPATHQRSVDYTLAKSRLGLGEFTAATVLLVVVLVSGCLPRFWDIWTARAGQGVWAGAGGLFVVLSVLSIASWPWEWWAQFRLEERFGFNTSTPKTWWSDRVKSLLLSATLGLPLIALLLQWVHWAGPLWWWWAWLTLIAFQTVLLVVAPMLILPLFNRFAPLPDGPLKNRLQTLSARTGFRARAIEVMDGSRRSRHANAFFTGLGRFRKIVLYDTLLNQLSEAEVEAVLAHEIGHARRRHLVKMAAVMAPLSLAAFAVVAWLANQPWFFAAFGFDSPSLPVAFLLFGLLADTVTFWFLPLTRHLTRRFEFEADRFAAEAVGTAQPLIDALRGLHLKNLSNLTPHPWYSAFHYSHPTLVERERALRASPFQAVASPPAGNA